MSKIESIKIEIINNKEKLDIANISIQEFAYLDTEICFHYNEISLSKRVEYPFFIFQEIRSELEKLEIKILCEGCRIDVYPSGMQLDSYSAYIMEPSKPAIVSVYIFDKATVLSNIGSVIEQEIFFEKWVDSVMPNR